MHSDRRPGFIRHQYDFAAHIRDPLKHAAPEGIEDRRMAVYRDLFYNNVEGFLSNTFPVLHELIDDEHWHAMARDFFSTHHCHSPLFLEIPREFLAYLNEERGHHDEDPPFLRELANYEWVELALSVAESGPQETGNPDGGLLNECPVLSSLAWPLTYRFPVHRISQDYQPEAPPEQPTYLLVYRDDKDKVGFIELNPVSARLFTLLQENSTLTGRKALELIAGELQHPDADVVIKGGLQILQEWTALGIVSGTARPV